MPAGRPPVSGGGAFVIPLSHAVNIRSLRLLARRRRPPPPLSKLELRERRHLLRRLVSKYRIACATPQPTATERRKTLSKIKTAARRFIKTEERLWADKLLDYLNTADVNTIALIRRNISSTKDDWRAWSSMKRQLGSLFSVANYPGEILSGTSARSQASLDRWEAFQASGISIVHELATINISELVPVSGHWPDPPLADLVAGLEPIWRRVTGRTAGLISVDAEADTKACPFAEWLRDILQAVGLARPSVERVVAIVRPRKRKICHPKRQ